MRSVDCSGNQRDAVRHMCKQIQLESQAGKHSERSRVKDAGRDGLGWGAVVVMVNGRTDQNVLARDRRDAKLKARVKLRAEVERCKQC
jgi:hypothetical protein